jgi:hypothetical protein
MDTYLINLAWMRIVRLVGYTPATWYLVGHFARVRRDNATAVQVNQRASYLGITSISSPGNYTWKRGGMCITELWFSLHFQGWPYSHTLSCIRSKKEMNFGFDTGI